VTPKDGDRHIAGVERGSPDVRIHRARRRGNLMLTQLAHGIMRHRWLVIGAWVFLTLFGVFAPR
jgi:hypothetical protein